MKQPVLYIAGYGRSGSTILELLLSQHPCVSPGGELSSFSEKLQNKSALCSCGAELRECEVWSSACERVSEIAESVGGLPLLTEVFAGYEGGFRNQKLHKLGVDRAGSLWRQVNTLVFDALARSNPHAKFIIDSSKSASRAARRPWHLRETLGMDVKVICLTRRIEDVLRSVQQGTNAQLESGSRQFPQDRFRVPRAAVGWIMANAHANRLQSEWPADTLSISYESLVSKTEETLNDIAHFINLDLEIVRESIEKRALLTDPSKHLVGGNRARFAGAHFRPAKITAQSGFLNELATFCARRLA